MTGSDFKDLCANISTCDKILFQTADGAMHEIYTAYRYHRGIVVLQEAGALMNKWPLKLKEPPQELMDYLNSL